MKKTISILLAALGFSACNYLEIEPVGKVIPHKLSEFRALITDGYYNYGLNNIRLYVGLLSDEVGTFDTSEFYDTGYAVSLPYNYTWQYNSQMQELAYRECYRSIFYANSLIDSVPEADNDSSGESKEQLLGEAYAIRAYVHFELVNIYGKPYDPATAATDRGIVLSTYTDIEQKYRPTNVAAVYKQILDDIEQAEKLLTVENYLTLETTERAKLNYRFTLDAVQAFKARVLLHMRDWQGAYDTATGLLTKYKLVDFNNLSVTESTGKGDNYDTALPWKPTSEEAILAWERPFSGGGGDYMNACHLSDRLLGLFDIKEKQVSEKTVLYSEDLRYNYIKSRSSGFIAARVSSDRTSLRIAEMYLIAAEAGSYLNGELDNAKNYLLGLQKTRFTAVGYAAKETTVRAMTAEQLRTEVADDRAREFPLEGHRWFDLRRTAQPAITKTYDGQTYTLSQNDSRYTLPFPQSAVNDNPELNN